MFLTQYAVAFAIAFFVADQGDDGAYVVDEHGQKYIEKTVYVPQWVTETRVCKETRYRTETREKECVTYTCKPVVKEVPYEYNVWVREPRTETQTFEVNTPVYRWEDQKYHEYYPSKMTVTRYRTKTVCEPVTCTKIICGEEVEVTENKLVSIQEPYQCEVDICVPVERTRKVKVYDTKVETKSVDHKYETVVSKTRTTMVKVCIEEKIPEVTRVPVQVCVPYTVEIPKQVRVCKMVPQTIQVPVCE